MDIFKRLKQGLSKTKEALTEKIDRLVASFRKVDEEFFDQLEEILIQSDISVETVMNIIGSLKEQVKLKNISDTEMIRDILKDVLLHTVQKNENNQLTLYNSENTGKLNIVLVVGVNGTGKTTSIGKLGNMLKSDNKKVMFAAADTFRAAAAEQLNEWAIRTKTDIVTAKSGADPASVVFNAIHAAKSREMDVLICDTAGRLHTKSNLMQELKKIRRVIDKEADDANVEVILVVDASSGQNSLVQARIFNEYVELSGIILTKLDGTAKGGIVISIVDQLGIPVKYIGIGEKADDLRPFDAKQFIDALFDI